jgi:hypothetical protein
VRRLLPLLLLVLVLPAGAVAQSPTPSPTVAATQDDDPGTVEDPGDAAPDDEGDDVSDDEGEDTGEDPGDYYCIPSDADYEYCAGGARCEATDDSDYYGGDYYYCVARPGTGPPLDDVPPEIEPEDTGGGGGGGGGSETGTGLPRTGNSPLLLALFGLGLLLAGSGGRLLTRVR